MCGNNNNNNTARRGLTYDGCNLFKQRLVLSTLNCKRVKIQNVRSKEDNPGLRDFVASYIRLLDKFSRLWADPGGRDLFLSAEQLSTPLGQGDPVLPEDLRRNWAKLLLEEIYKDPIMRNRWLEFVGPQCSGGPPSQHHLIRLPVAVVGEMSRWQHNMQHSEDLHQYHADLTSLIFDGGPEANLRCFGKDLYLQPHLLPAHQWSSMRTELETCMEPAHGDRRA
uniref:RNA 3'-terminal phosphate cyclase domain-containing protein n=1 Tax=Hucho hucho TaxID=62062 RepID=A0A4W5QDJ4_9TELE